MNSFVITHVNSLPFRIGGNGKSCQLCFDR